MWIQINQSQTSFSNWEIQMWATILPSRLHFHLSRNVVTAWLHNNMFLASGQQGTWEMLLLHARRPSLPSKHTSTSNMCGCGSLLLHCIKTWLPKSWWILCAQWSSQWAQLLVYCFLNQTHATPSEIKLCMQVSATDYTKCNCFANRRLLEVEK